MARVWEWVVDGQSQVRATLGSFGRIVVEVDGQEVQRERISMTMKSTDIALPSRAQAELRYGSPFGVGFRIELRRASKLVLPFRAPKGYPVMLNACPHCKASVRSNDRFCDGCGKPLPSNDDIASMSEVQRGNSVIGVVGILFLLSGCAMYMAQRIAANEALKKIAGFDADAPLANPIPGVAAKTFGELRAQIEWEANSVLVVNALLALLMFGLWHWGKHKPTAAIIVAFCTYLVVVVTNAAIDPRTLAQGWLMKFIVFAYLLRALKAALALRSAKLSAA